MTEGKENPVTRIGVNRAGASILGGNEVYSITRREGCNAHFAQRFIPSEIQLWQNEFYELAQEAGFTQTKEFICGRGLKHKTLINLGILISILRVKFAKKRFDFAFPDEGEWACVFEVIEERQVPPYDQTELVVIDLVAFSIDNPAKFGTALGRAVGLGIGNAANPASCYKTPLRVWKTPLRWLQEECAGCIVLEAWSAPQWLAECPGLISGETLEHSRQIARMLHGVFDVNRVVARRKDR